MKGNPQRKTMPIVLAVFAIFGIWVLVLPEIDGFSVFHAMVAVPEASASAVYGIRGERAPELNLDTWIDGDGNQMTPIRLENYRGRVVYLYFFQDW